MRVSQLYAPTLREVPAEAVIESHKLMLRAGYIRKVAGGLYSYSTMCSGPYNNNGRTPPYFNAEELIMLGWMDGYTEIESQGSLTVTPVQNRVAYRIPTSTDGEYFVLECRGKTGWDSALDAERWLEWEDYRFHYDLLNLSHVIDIYDYWRRLPRNAEEEELSIEEM